MNEAQRRELQQIRHEQNTLADRLARLESRLRFIEQETEPAPSGPSSAAEPPRPVTPPDGPPPLPPAAFAAPASEKPSEPPPLPVVPPVAAPAGETMEPAAPKESLEVRIGSTWLVRVGVVMMLTALAFLGSYLYKNVVPRLGPAAKVGLLYLGAGALAGAGAWLERSQEASRSPRMLNFARVVLAGGLAAVYYVTYAAHWNPNLLVLQSAPLDGALLIAWTAFMVWLADRRASETLATFAILLAYYASAVNEIAAFTLFSNLLLTVAAVSLLRRHLWRVFPYASLLATFGSYGFWRYYHAYQSWVRPEQVAASPGRFWTEGVFLAIYWLLFTGSVFAPGAATWTPRRRAGFAALNNAAFFLLTTWILQGAYPGHFWQWSLGFGVVLCGLAETCRRVRPRVDAETEGSYLLQGILLVTVGFFAYFSGWQLSLVLAAQSVVLLGHALRREERLPLWASMASAAASFMVAADYLGDGASAVPWPSTAGAGALLVFNAWWSQRRREKEPVVSTDAGPSAAPGFPTALAVAPGYFSALGFALWLWIIERTLAGDATLVPVLAAAALALTASVYVLRVAVVPFYAQAFLLAAYLHRFAADDLAGASGPGVPAGSMASLLIVTLALGHWWQQRWPWTDGRLRPPNTASRYPAVGDAILAALLLYDGSRPGVGSGMTPAAGVALDAALCLGLLAYGLWTRYRALAAAGQLLLLASVAGCVFRVWTPPWPGGFGSEPALTLAPLAVLLATVFAGRRYAAVAFLAVYEAAATLFFLGWVCRYVPADARFAVFGIAGAVVSGWAQVRCTPRWLWWSGLLTIAGALTLALLSREEQAAWWHLLAVAAIAGQQQFARFWIRQHPAAVPAAPTRWQAALMVLAVLCAWVLLDARMTLSFEGAFTLAAAWSLFAAGIFVAGLTLREKVYRWLGLGILVCTLARISTVDIWQLDSLGRAVSALCLGTVLLGIGYLYNRFHAKWHGLF